MKMIVVISHDIHPELVSFLNTVKTVNPAEISAGGIVLDVWDIDSLPGDMRAYGRRIQEIKRVLQQVGHYELAKATLSGSHTSIDKCIQQRKNGLAGILNCLAGRDLSAEEMAWIFDYVTLGLRIRRYDGKKNSFNTVINQLREAVKIKS